MKTSLRGLTLAACMAMSISLVVWIEIVLHRFNVPEPQWRTLANGLMDGFSNPELRWVSFLSLAVGFVATFGLWAMWADASRDDDRVVRGTALVEAKQLVKLARDRKFVQTMLAGVPLPLACEPSHFLLAGSTNTGKSTGINELIASAIARGDRLIMVDPNGHSLARFYQKGDVVLNPFDKRSVQWSLFNEIRSEYDFEWLAKSVVPDSANATDQAWHGYAQQLLAGVLRAMMVVGENSTERLLYWVTQAPTEELAKFLMGTPVAGLFEAGADKALASTRFILASHIGGYQHLRSGDFSLRTWLEKGQGNLYLTWREDMLSTLKPLVSGWVDVLVASILIMPTDNPRPLWLILDELASLEHLNSLEKGLTKGRKHGLRVVAGLQSVSQLDALYGHDASKTLRSCFRSVLALGCSNADPDTAEFISRGLGEVEIERVHVTRNDGKNGQGTSRSRQRSKERLVTASELMNLAPLKGFIKLAGDWPVAKIELRPVDRSIIVKPFVSR